jgi:hypothetical protein
MTEQPNEQKTPNPPTPQIEKLLIDDPFNFQFHAAYLVYEEAFDKVSDVQAKTELNQNLQDLKDSKIDLETFYGNISRYRHVEQMPRQGGRLTVATQRKKDWRKKTQRSERIKRHKK